MAQQSWRSLEKRSWFTARGIRRTVLSLVFLGLLVWLILLLVRPLMQPHPHGFWLAASGETVAEGSGGIYGDADRAAFAALVQSFAPGGRPGAAMQLEHLRSRAAMETLGTDLDRASPNAGDHLILYVSTIGVTDGGQPFLRCGDFDPLAADSGRYPLHDFLSQVRRCRAAVKLLLLDTDRDDYTLRRGALGCDFPALLRAAVAGTRDRSLWVLTANSALERPYVSPALERSVFSYFVTLGLAGPADLDGDTTITLDELHRYVAANVGAFVKAATQGLASQTPELLWGGGPLTPDATYPHLVTWPRSTRQPSVTDLSAAIQAARPKSRIAAYRVLAAKLPQGAADASGPPQDLPRDPPASAAGAKPKDGGDSKEQEKEKTAPEPVTAAGGGEPQPNVAAAKDAPTAAAPDPEQEARQRARLETAQLLAEGWQLRDALDARGPDTQKPAPASLAPHLWREFQERLVRYDQRFRQEAIANERAFTEEVEDLVVALRQFAAGKALARSSSGALLEQIARRTAPRWPAPAEARSLALAEYLAQRSGGPLPADWKDRATALDGFLADAEPAKFHDWAAKQLTPEYARFSELRLAKQLAGDPQISWPDKQLALRTRRAAEQAAARAVGCLPWVRAKIETADRRRLEAERLLFDRIGKEWQPQARQLLASALTLYREAASDAGDVLAVEHLTRRLTSRVPDYVRWRTLAGPDPRPSIPDHAVVEGLLDVLATTAALLEEPDPGRRDDLLAGRTQLARYQQQIEADFQDASLAVLVKAAGDVRMLDGLLATPLPTATARVRLLANIPDVEARLLARASFPNPRETNPGARVPAREDCRRWLHQARLELKLARLVLARPAPERVAADASDEIFLPVHEAYQRLEQALAAPAYAAAVPPALSAFGAALQTFYGAWPQHVHDLMRPQRDRPGPTTRDARRHMLWTALRTQTLIASRQTVVPETLNLDDALRQSAQYDWLNWQRDRILMARCDAPPDEARDLTEAARAYRTLAMSLDGESPAPDDVPPQVTIAGPTSLSLTANPQVDLRFTVANTTTRAIDVWPILQYDRSVLEVEIRSGQAVPEQETLPATLSRLVAERTRTSPTAPASPPPSATRPPAGDDLDPQRAAEYPCRPDRVSGPGKLELERGGTSVFDLRVRRKQPAAAPTRLIFKTLAVPHDVTGAPWVYSYARQQVDIDLPVTEALELQVAGVPGSWSTLDGRLVLHPFPNRTSAYQFRLVNPAAQNKRVTLQWLGGEPPRDLALPPGVVSAHEAEQFLESLGPTSVVVPAVDTELPGGGIPVPVPFLAGPPAGAAGTSNKEEKPAPASSPTAESAGGRQPLPSSLILAVTDRETGRKLFRRMDLRPQRPRKYVRPRVGYDPARERIEIHLAAARPDALPAGPVRVHGEFVGEVPPGMQTVLDAELDASQPAIALYARMPAARGRVVTLHLSVDGYPRAFVYEVPCWELAANVPEKRDLMSVRVTDLPKGRSYKTPAGPVPIAFQVDAPLGAFDNAEDVLRVGFDLNRDRELTGEPVTVLHSDRQARLFLERLTSPGGMTLSAVVGDFQLDLPAPRMRSIRADVLAELSVAGRTAWSPPREIVFDGTPPRVYKPRIKPGPDTPQGTDLELSVLASDDDLSGVAKVEAALDLKQLGRFAEDAPPVEATLDTEAGTWVAKLPTAEVPPGAYRLLTRATDAVGNASEYLVIDVRVTPVDPQTAADNQVQGRVLFDRRPIAGIEVKLTAVQGPTIAPLQTDALGRFLFPKVPLGKYKLLARGVVHNKVRTAEAELEVVAPPAATKSPELNLR